MKHFLCTLAFSIIIIANIFAQVGKTYTVLETPSGTFEWGDINPSNGTINNAVPISSTLGIQGNVSCMDNQNGIIYFMDEYTGTSTSIVSLDVNNGILSMQTIPDNNTYIALLEYSSTSDKLYAIQESNNGVEWGEMNPSTGVVSNLTGLNVTINQIGIVDFGGSCIDEQNGIIYFTDYNSNDDQTIMSLNTNTGIATEQVLSQEIRYVEYSNSLSKLFCLTDNGTSVGWAEVDASTGNVFNFIAFPVTVSYINDAPGTCIDQQNEILYFAQSDYEGAQTHSIVSINLNSEVVTKEATSYFILVMEHWNEASSSINTIAPSKNYVNVYPNPFTNQVQIIPIDGFTITELNIYTISGQKIFASKMLEKIYFHNNEIENGVYIIEFITEKGYVIREKLVKN